ncbi:unnamed protein product, partial [Ectocarpus sp. 12 AP-2014]
DVFPVTARLSRWGATAGAATAPAVAGSCSEAARVGENGGSPGAGGTVAPTSAARGKYKTKPEKEVEPAERKGVIEMANAVG